MNPNKFVEHFNSGSLLDLALIIFKKCSSLGGFRVKSYDFSIFVARTNEIINKMTNKLSVINHKNWRKKNQSAWSIKRNKSIFSYLILKKNYLRRRYYAIEKRKGREKEKLYNKHVGEENKKFFFSFPVRSFSHQGFFPYDNKKTDKTNQNR